MTLRPLSAALLLALSLPLHAQFTEDNPERTDLAKVIEVPFGTLWGDGTKDYSPTFGVVLWKTPGAHLFETIYEAVPEGEGGVIANLVNPIVAEETKRILGDGKLGKKLESSITKRIEKEYGKQIDKKNLIEVTDYVKKHGGNRRLSFENETGSALILRVRNSFEFYNEDSGAAEFNYVDNGSGGGNGSSYHAAAMLDIYNDYFYNRNSVRRTGWVRNPYRFSFRLGAQFDYLESDTAPEDTQKFYALATFAANPDQKARFLRIHGAEITSPQILQVGAVYTRNQHDDSDSVTPIIGWQPRLRFDKGFGANNRFKGFSLNQRMYYQRESFGHMWLGAEESKKEVSQYYSFIKPQIFLQGPDGASVNIVDRPASILDKLDKLQESSLKWDVTAGMGFKDGFWELSAEAHGVHPLANLGESHIWYGARAEFRFKSWHDQYSFDETGGGKPKAERKWAGVNLFVAYTGGEAPPNYVQVDRIEAGVGVRF